MASVPPVSMSDNSSVDVWEEALLKEVVRTVNEIWVVAGRPKTVLMAVDGVVPSAKIRQQRVRRFKSAWLRSSGNSSWDSNSITPGTDFMKKLTRVLEGVVKEHGKGWTLSSVDEAGEGEHKIMRWLRATRAKAGNAAKTGNASKDESIVVYGLDADLILLSMLNGEIINKPLWLLRENQEFGGTEQEYTFMNIEDFKNRLSLSSYDDIINYIGLMSLMGNDFLPHSLTHKLNDDGHECVVEEFTRMKRSSRWLIVDGSLQKDVLLDLCKRWSVDEDRRMESMLRKKREQAGRGVGKGMDPSEGLPLEWNVEKFLVGDDMRLLKDWRGRYWSWIHPNADRDKICSEYLVGCQWILDYYLGKDVNMMWMFPSWIPPLWSDLAKYIESGEDCVKEYCLVDPIRPEEQLAMVLPLDSWGLVRDQRLRRLPALAPQMWPAQFSFFSAGRKWLWECEARVPVLTAERLREILSRAE